MLSPLASAASLGQQPAGPDKVFHLAATRGPDGALLLDWSIAPGNYLYRDKIAVTTADGTGVEITTLPGEIKDDPSFGRTEVYHRRAQASIPRAVAQAHARLAVSYQGCAEQGICYPPIRRSVDTASLELSASAPPPKAPTSTVSNWTSDLDLSQARSETGSPIDSAEPGLRGGFVPMLLAFVGFGLLLAFTPCVFPMIPILSGMLARSGEGLTATRGFALSGVYVLAMASAYAALGVAVAWSGQNLQAALQTPLALGLMSGVFVALALSMFGLFDLQLPASWQTRFLGAGSGRGGSLGGAAALGFGSALIVGPCVTPPLAAALVYVAQTGDVVRGAAALFALGTGMGLPLLMFGTFGASLLPRSGPWLAKVKYVFGLVFVGMAVWMLSRVIPQWATGLLIGLCLAGAGAAIAATLFRRPQLRRSWQAVVASIGMLILGVGVVTMIASLNGSSDRLAALVGLPSLASAQAAHQAPFEIVKTTRALDQAIASARRNGQLVVLDFSADWCVECKVMDRNIFSNPDVIAQLRGFTLIRADATDYNQDIQSLMGKYGVVGPPTVVFLDPQNGAELPDTRFIGAVGRELFTARLRQLQNPT
ncbi:protein-disulfide reductase DsbD [Rhodopseudomonas sp. BAL398]|nr:protein-disulfide reductase DsbD [Rhodopseudomonas sp. BAL398]WOK15781.1 protein-disulfide reductase DsbD [Rhodopseudomonas sp. BAL398]